MHSTSAQGRADPVRPLHTKLDPQPAWARFVDVIVRLDTGALVAVFVENIADLTGGTSIEASARAVDREGKPILNAAGLPVVTHLHQPYRTDDLDARGVRLVDLQRDCVRAVLGEPTVHAFTDTAGLALREKVSIRNRIRDAGAAAAARRAGAA